MKDTRDIKDTSGLKPITDIREIQSIERGILERVATFCEERGIRYSLIGGTLLGAVRHKGFIPWDDDIDIAMPRADYERFIGEFNAEGLSLHCIENDKNYWLWYIKVFDERTVAIGGGDDPEGRVGCVFIDIFPMDGFPDMETIQGVFLRFRRLWKCHYLKTRPFGLVMHTQKRAFYKMAVVQVAKLVVKLVFCFLPKQYFLKAITKNFSRYGYENQPYIGNSCWHVHKQNMPWDCAKSYVDVEFEGRQYKAIAGWDTYLTNTYGDYMTPPPEEKRGGHGFKAWWK